MRQPFCHNTYSSFDFYPFGMIIPGRSYTATSSYKFGYQGSLKDEEITVAGGTYSTFFRELDVRDGRWYSLDPESKAWESPYVAMGDNPIKNNDVKGNTVKDDYKLGKDGTVSLIKQTHDKANKFFDDKGKFLFSVDNNPRPREDFKKLPPTEQVEVAWATAKVGLAVNASTDLKNQMIKRGNEEAWNAKPSVNVLDNLGKRNNVMLKTDLIAAVFSADLWPSQSTREGQPSSVIGLFSSKALNVIDATYTAATHGRDLQKDIMSLKPERDHKEEKIEYNIWQKTLHDR